MEAGPLTACSFWTWSCHGCILVSFCTSHKVAWWPLSWWQMLWWHRAFVVMAWCHCTINATPINALVLDGLVCLFVTVEVALVALGGSLTLRLLQSCQQHCLSATNLKMCSFGIFVYFVHFCIFLCASMSKYWHAQLPFYSAMYTVYHGCKLHCWCVWTCNTTQYLVIPCNTLHTL